MEPPLLDKSTVSELRVRDRVLVWYNGDTVWHERLLVRPVSSALWFIATPDRDAYLERLVGGARSDSPVKCVLMVKGVVPVGLRGDTHLFLSEVSENEWSRLREASEEVCAGPLGKSMLLRGEKAWDDEKVTPVALEDVASFGLDRSPRLRSDAYVWLLSSPLLDDKGAVVYDAGLEMEVVKSDLLGAKFGVHFLATGEEVMVERVPRELVPRFVPLKRDVAPGSAGAGGAVVHAGGAEGLRNELAKKAADEGADGEDDGDMRILTVEYDSSGERLRDWRSAVAVFKEDPFPDWPLSGPRSVMWLSTFFVKLSLSPSLWLERHLQTEGWSSTDRSVHELRVLAEVLELAAQYDQLNLGSLACMERLCRRWQAILEAHTRDPAQPDYEAAEAFSGTVNRRVCVAPSLRAHVAREMRDEAEIDKQRVKAKDLRGTVRGGGLRRGKKGGGGGDAPAKDE